MALDRYTEVKFIGLCHQIWEGYKRIAEITGVDTDDFDIKAAGLNHFTLCIPSIDEAPPRISIRTFGNTTTAFSVKNSPSRAG